jgi:transcriptional regulator with XRE-family HTH domain
MRDGTKDKAGTMKDKVHVKTLREWMVEKDISQRQLARLLNTRQQNVNRWVAVATPELAVIHQIKHLTRGEVDYEGFLLWHKVEGDRRLVQAGKISPEVMDRWEALKASGISGFQSIV